MKFTFALTTPSIFLMASSIFAPQFAQPSSSSLNVFFMIVLLFVYGTAVPVQ